MVVMPFVEVLLVGSLEHAVGLKRRLGLFEVGVGLVHHWL